MDQSSCSVRFHRKSDNFLLKYQINVIFLYFVRFFSESAGKGMPGKRERVRLLVKLSFLPSAHNAFVLLLASGLSKCGLT